MKKILSVVTGSVVFGALMFWPSLPNVSEAALGRGNHSGGNNASFSGSVNSSVVNATFVDAGVVAAGSVNGGVINTTYVDAGTVNAITSLTAFGYTDPFARHPGIRTTCEMWIEGGGGIVSAGCGANAAATGTALQFDIAAEHFHGIRYTTGNVTGNVAGTCNTGSQGMNAGMMQLPRGVVRIRTDSVLTGYRLWAGFDTVSPATTVATAGPTALANDFIMIGFEKANSNQFQCCSNDFTNYTCTDIPSATVAASTIYDLEVDGSDPTAVTCRVRTIDTNGNVTAAYSLRKITNLPRYGSAVYTSNNWCAATTENVAHLFYFAHFGGDRL